MSDTEKSLLASLDAEITRAEPRPSSERPDGGDARAASLESLRERPRRNRERGRRESLDADSSSRDQEVVASEAPRRRRDGERRQQLSSITPLPQVPERQRREVGFALPQARKGRSYGTLVSFLLLVALPILVTSIYYFLFASNQYVSEFRFAVREASTPTSSSALSMSSISSLLGTSGSSASIENYAVADYLTSRQAVDDLQAAINVKALYSRPAIDRWARFDPSKPTEKFVEYWQSMVSAQFDMITGIAVANVRAFTPEDAELIAKTMMSLAEKLVNDMAMRSRQDSVRFAERDVKRAQERLNQVRTQISAYRDKESVIDPTSNVVASNTTLAQTLRTTLMQYQTELSALRRQALREDAPAVLALQSRIYAANQQLAVVEAQVATAKDGSRPLSRVVSQYETLQLEQQVAQTILTTAIQSLEQARVNASIQHLYVTPFVRPARPESSTYPERLKSIAMVGLVCFFLWTIGLLVTRSILDHLA